METLSDSTQGLCVGEPAVFERADPLGQSGADALIPLPLECGESVLELLVSASPTDPRPRCALADKGEDGNGDGKLISLHRPTYPLLG